MMRVKKRLDSSNYCYYFSFCIYLNRGDFINYTVKSGDTLYGISNQFGVSVVELANLNNVTASTLKVGQVLIIPTNSGTNPNNLFLYTVVSGDSLYKIARKYNTTVDEIVKLNNLKSTSLKIGDVLRIPEMYTPESQMIMPSYINYTVKKGDNLYSIARSYNIDINVLKKDNGLTSNLLNIGEVLRIRVTPESVSVEECIGPDYTPPASSMNYKLYTVKKGDSLYSIARANNTTASILTSINNLTSNNLSIGQQLKIPIGSNASSSTTVYTVKSGDSLYSIAKKFNTTVDSIKKKNNLTSNALSIGQKLNI